ncbi:hypothetical protein QAD02_019258 [Eretmocerus hayati]|uniref:Uncharacterized protein n=1 Tax=Eretmocerus hayati TaxID=131215 RepID=A0ACC2PJ38_9HYME|nr:hypothetical protein QAD02_019258 [Eretmocerus hayati]
MLMGFAYLLIVFDYSDGTFSPPADDPFFCIHYPKQQTSTTSSTSTTNTTEGFRSITEFLGVSKTESNVTGTASKLLSGNNPAGVDFSKHPIECQEFIPFAANKGKEPKIIVANKIKRPIAEDDFNNDKAAECGRSIVTVASQIMSFGKFSSADSSSSSNAAQNQSQADESVVQKQNSKTVSKSLPASPLISPSGTPDNSPRSRRRAYGNRFFTGAFVPDPNQKNGWLLSSILGQSRDLVSAKIDEEDEQQTIETVPPRALSRKKSISSQNLTYIGKKDESATDKATTSSTTNVLQVKPSELREMNFWSPTSM